MIGANIAWGAIEPESIMPVQYADLRRSATAKPPVLRLMSAVLLDALRRRAHTLGRSDRRRREILRETEAWLASDDESWPFAFVIVCAGLGLEPESIRAALRGRKGDFRWQQRAHDRDPMPAIRRASSRRRHRGARGYGHASSFPSATL